MRAALFIFMKYGTLYLVPTPIGNLEDMTYRAVRILQEVHLIAAEDTRTSAKLMKHYDIRTQMVSYHKFNEAARSESIVEKLKEGKDIAVISDAGSPGVSDPSNIIVKKALENGIEVSALPGATAFVPAVTASGFSSDSFLFKGFIPDKQTLRHEFYEFLSTVEYPVIIYEAPHRILKTLAEILEHSGDRDICIAREISKKFETYYRGAVSQFTDSEEVKLKGEFVVVIGPAEQQEITDEYLVEMVLKYVSEGMKTKAAVKKTAEETGESKNRIYELAIQYKS